VNDIHDFFQTPPDDAVIWRYRKFPHFKAIVKNKALHFTSASSLDDPLEGKNPRLALEKWKQHREIGDQFISQYGRSLHCFYVNSWTVQEGEDMGMWEEFCGKDDRGVVIKSSFKRLRESFLSLSDGAKVDSTPRWAHESVYFGLVRYINHHAFTDFDKVYEYYRGFEKICNVEGMRWFEIAHDAIRGEVSVDPFPTLPPILYVDKKWKSEKELRVIVVPYSTEVLAEASEGSIDILVDLSNLIECIHVTPTANTGFTDEVIEYWEEHDLDVPVYSSRLS